MRLLIKNAYVVNEGTISIKEILIEGSHIEKIGRDIVVGDDTDILDAKGKYLLPGVIDDQVHFRDPGLTHKADIYTESKAGIAGGVTSFIEMPNTIPQTTTIDLIEEKVGIAQRNSWSNYSFMLGATNFNIEEIEKIDPNKIPGLKIFMGSSTGNMLVDDYSILKNIFSKAKCLIVVHCEDEQTIKENTKKYVEKYGEDIPISFHPHIRSEESCYISSSKAIEIAKETGARLHIFHISTARETDLFRNDIPLKDKNITSEVCVHHLYFNENDYEKRGTHIKWNPAIKTKRDQEALWRALLEDKIDIIATDHAPHTLEEKNNSYLKAPSGGPLIQHALQIMLEACLKKEITLEKVVEKMCHNPAILYKIEKRGFIREGYFADLVLVDLDSLYTVDKSNILYKCGWSPLEGDTFRSSIYSTIVNGKIVYANGVFHEENKSPMRLIFNR
ncbi:dihydroorotase [Ichthyobacterium seriolicida]|uniref:Dihydroorotase n=1 Tax=Ichthyobacterium seriolicida TaxID=242600 RepID=A0A1J1DYC2_9FLAO|nr:dihydroorotase [Ichthyobacterium seriolicida]BAV94857.1 dihydroorotase [Ichthyobacterium seriolicida]